MKTLEYVNEYGLDKLQEDYGIKVAQNEAYPDLYCLNYDQISSPKLEPIVQECRSLVLRKHADGGYSVDSRSFDRFFNYGEIEGVDHDITKLVAHEKVDGSLVGVWYSEGYGWLYRTRSMVMPENMPINGHNVSWGELIESTIEYPSLVLEKNCTYIFEVVSTWNRVVTRYNDKAAYLLAIRENSTGEYLNMDVLPRHWKRPKQYKFDSIEHCMESAKHLPNLEEGYVLYTHEGKPVVKVKNPAYVAAHHLRGEGTPTPKRIMDLVIANETDEYLAIFPEDLSIFQPYMTAFYKGLDKVTEVYEDVKGIADQKEFAMAIKHLPYSPLLFTMRNRGDAAYQAFNRLLTQGKYKFIETFLEDQ